jgi:hypothetical protein
MGGRTRCAVGLIPTIASLGRIPGPLARRSGRSLGGERGAVGIGDVAGEDDRAAMQRDRLDGVAKLTPRA